MARKTNVNPTDGELEILQVLWKKGACSVHDVQAELGEKTGYTTILKLLQIMLQKGLVKRDDARRPHIYEASEPAVDTKSKFVGSVAKKLFGGSSANLAMHALSHTDISKSEMEDIRNLIEELSNKGGEEE